MAPTCFCRNFTQAILGHFRGLRWLSGQFTRNPRSGRRIAEVLGAHGHQRGPRIEQITRVTGALDPAHADDGDLHRGGDRRDLRERDRANRRARQPARVAA